MKNLFFIACTGMILSSCTKEPVASFTVSVSAPVTDEVITFTNTSDNGVTYEWI